MESYVTFKLSSLTEMFADGDQRVETGSLQDAYRSSKKRQLAHIKDSHYISRNCNKHWRQHASNHA